MPPEPEHRMSTVSRGWAAATCATIAPALSSEPQYTRFARLLGPGADLSDAARTALAFFRSTRVPEVLLECRVGRMMAARGLAHEVEFACRFDACPIVPVLENGRLRCA